ncbi:MAG: alpha/beta hydrolase [Myxococcales bacterium]|nr:alpha/beta hydrolase [Myxococcales bacterium]
MFARSKDGVEIYYEVTGDADTALVFVHGWMGNVRWWDAQRDAFASTHRVVALDLAGHGQSGRTRTQWSAEAYAEDIIAVVQAVSAPRVVLVAHSMAGAYALTACPALEGLARLILVDTLKNLDATPTLEQVAPMMASYRADYRAAVETALPRFLFSAQTPPAVVERLTREFLTVTGDVAVTLLEPLYRLDLRAAARSVQVPVRGIGSDLNPGNVEANRAYFRDYAYVELTGCGHYPMLEAPGAFNVALRTHLVHQG